MTDADAFSDERSLQTRLSTTLFKNYNNVSFVDLATPMPDRIKLKQEFYSRELPPYLQSKIANLSTKLSAKSTDTTPKELIRSVDARDKEMILAEKSKARNQVLSSSHNSEVQTDHPEWKLMRVIAGHQGWVRSVAVEPDNQWFATGSADRTIKIWDLASGQQKLTLTGHSMAIRGLAVSDRHPYLFSAGEDKMIKCWDLEMNKVVRDYHGHISAVYSLSLHPTVDVLVTGGRDSSVRIWDMRTRRAIHVLTGHKAAVFSVMTQPVDPQIISGSADASVKLWDIVAGRAMQTLTHHKKGVRSLAIHPAEWTFASASADSVRQWRLPDGAYLQSFSQNTPTRDDIINTLSVNEDGVLFAGGDNGTMRFYDYKTARSFQISKAIAAPGSLESENGILASTFDKSGSRLITCGADKTIKVWREETI